MDTWLDIEKQRLAEWKREMKEACEECPDHGNDGCPWDDNVFECWKHGDGPFFQPF